MGQWDSIKSSDVRKAINNALQGDDNRLTHSDIVEIVRATLIDGNVTLSELNDLTIVARNSVTIEHRSTMMLAYLMGNRDFASSSLFAFPRAGQQVAADRLCDFMKRSGRSHFPNLDRDRVGIDIMMRVAMPGLINQSKTELCGPVALLYSLALRTPLDYAQFAIDLYENGRARVGDLEVKPRFDCRNYSPPSHFAQGDWLTAASLRDSENWYLDFDDVEKEWAAGTSVSEFARWFKNAGFVNVDYQTNDRSYIRDPMIIDIINRYFDNRYIVVLVINSKLLTPDTQGYSSSEPNHFAVLRSRIVSTPASVRLTMYSHGNGDYQIPQGVPIEPSGFLRHLYGYLIAKPY